MPMPTIIPPPSHHVSSSPAQARRSSNSEMESVIRLVPINAIEVAFLDRLAVCLEERFLCAVTVERALTIARSALNSTRQQLFLSTLFTKVRRVHPEGAGIYLALTEF